MKNSSGQSVSAPSRSAFRSAKVPGSLTSNRVFLRLWDGGSGSMARRDAGLLLLLALCFLSDVTLVETARGDPGGTPVCSGAALQNATLIVCQIRTGRRREDCRVLYRHQQNLSSECGSGFRLVTENQTLFLQAEDGGNHTCECSHLQGTVEAGAEEGGVVSDLSMLGFTTAVSSAFGLVVVAAALLGLVLRNAALRAQRQAELQNPPSKGDDDGAYASLQQPTDDLYQTIDRRDPAPRVTQVTWVIQEAEIYENP